MKRLAFNTIRNLIIKRVRSIEYDISRPIETQIKVLNNLLLSAKQTEWGKKYDFTTIKNPKVFKERIRVQDYESIKPEIFRMLKGENNILWPGTFKWFAKSSGTTNNKSKFIPVSNEAINNCHNKAGKDLLAIYHKIREDAAIFKGYGVALGGSHQFNKLNQNSYIGDLSAILMQNLPFWTKLWQQPNIKTSMLSDWEEKINTMAHEVINKNITHLSGVPTWTVVLINKILEISGKEKLNHVWPNLEFYAHGGVSFKPYQNLFHKLIPTDKMFYMETYNASEGFFAFQDKADSNDLLLLINHGIYYEFIPVEEIDKDDPKAIGLPDVEENKNYALVISTNSGLWRYIIGDTIKFTSLNPFRIRLTGRTRNFINAFGEEVIIENAERAISEACNKCDAEINDFTVAPKYFSNKTNGAHEWVIEFKKEPDDLEAFKKVLDQTLMDVNSDYECKRFIDIALSPPLIIKVESGTFYQWMKKRGKLGGQNKVPRLYNERSYVEDIKLFAGVE